ncbi:MAG: aminoglycoside 3'-phosphotransferase [Clostridia bacterium]|nr:aminoglycoside 3'-phosphotransferase [Clostridia bacterium]
MTLPNEIARIVGDRPYRAEDIGRSGSCVLMFEDMVLKIGTADEAAENECRILRWLDGKLAVPRVLSCVREDGRLYLLMTRLVGRMACDATLLHAEAVSGLARGLRALWRVEISDCPVSHTTAERLAAARERLASGKLDGLTPSTGGSFAALLAWLEANCPTEEPVFSHGDYCLPNVFLCEGDAVAFLDLGYAGVSDRWYDIMMCLWSLRYNFCELGGMGDEEFEAYRALFFRELGLDANEEKLRYHALLDEFFQM